MRIVVLYHVNRHLLFFPPRRHHRKEGGVPLRGQGLRGRGALGHRQLHALLLPAGSDPLLNRQLPPSALLGAHQRGRELLPNMSRYLNHCPAAC